MSTDPIAAAMPAIEPAQAVLLADVVDALVWQDVTGRVWHDGRPVDTAVREVLRELDRLELVELGPAPVEAHPALRHRRWLATGRGSDVLAEVTAVLADAGLTLAEVRRGVERLHRDGVL